ncbi:MAG: DUF262 domain-containing protein [Vampirovibrio sp.]|nr:DUF262 domain-containing protein [Vampirovibrio sp.]
MKANQKSFLRYMDGTDKQFIIPVYQRNYDWQRKHCVKLLEDIDLIIEKDLQQYFLGSIVSTHSTEGNSEFSEHLVIDGQQRLTTVTLILLALYKLLKNDSIQSNSKTLKDKIYTSYLVNQHSCDEAKRIRLKPIDKDNNAFLSIFEDDFTPSNDIEAQNINIIANYLYIEKELKTKFQYADPSSIDAFYTGLSRLMIVDIELSAEDNPQLIFESLNHAGKKLEESDLIRNYILMNLSAKEQEKFYKYYWHPIEVNTNYQTSEFIRHALSYKKGEVPNKNRVYEEFKRYIDDVLKKDTLEAVLKELKTLSQYYGYLLKSNSGWKQLDTAIESLNDLGVTVCYPFLLDVLTKYYSMGELNEDETLKCFKIMETFIFRRSIVGLPSNALNKFLVGLAKKIKNSGSNISYTHKLAYVLAKENNCRLPSDEEFKYSLLTKEIYNGQKRVCEYLLGKLEHYDHKEPVDLEQCTIEHIMPQTLSSQWHAELGSDSERIHKQYLHTLGNLTYTGYNSKYSNSPFKAKLEMDKGLNESRLRLNQSVKNKQYWTESAIKSRGEELAELALRIWAYPSNIPIADEQKEQEPTGLLIYLSDEYEDGDVTGNKVKTVTIFGTTYPITSWKELYTLTFELLAKKDELLFKQVAQGKLFKTSTECRRSPHQLPNGYWIETGWSAITILNYVMKALKGFQASDEDFILQVDQ